MKEKSGMSAGLFFDRKNCLLIDNYIVEFFENFLHT